MTMTPLLAGVLAMLACGIGLAGIPMLRDRGPLDRLVARAGASRSITSSTSRGARRG
jgi:hypothetical protein